MKKLKDPEVMEQESLVYNPLVKHQVSKSPDILRIENDPDFTKIDFIVYASPKYINGGWVQMNIDSFIRPVGSSLHLKLISAVNIPIAPAMHYFKTKQDFLCYTLVFPALPCGTKSIDIIEKEIAGDRSYFNFYGVSMQKVYTERLLVGN